jgi:hypothetical protein
MDSDEIAAYAAFALGALVPFGQPQRLSAAIVPPPRVHSTRYFGAFAPHSELRPKVVAMPDQLVPDTKNDGGATMAQAQYELSERERYQPLAQGPPQPQRKRCLCWARLLRRTFAVDVLVCE